jgi:GTP-binding protein YchF
MGFQCGIVGLPNVGKSTLFNALTQTAAAQAANFPFCTIEPNIGRVAVPDARIDKIAAIGKSATIIPAQMEFVDIAGLVKGASKGEGLGNQFLANIREVDAVVHVVRCFVDENIIHVEGSVDPLRDVEVIETELMLADLESVERQLPQLEKKAKGGDDDAKTKVALLGRIQKALADGLPARTIVPAHDEVKAYGQLQLLTSKKVLFVCNVPESDAAHGNDMSKKVFEYAGKQGAEAVVICAAIESEIAQLADEAERKEFLETIGLAEPGLNRIIRAAYKLLGLQTYFTVGPKEARAWTIYIGDKAPAAAGAIHSDFEKGFIRAETIAYADYVALGGEAAAREAGKLRSEGKEYIVQDGDVLLFRFSS